MGFELPTTGLEKLLGDLLFNRLADHKESRRHRVPNLRIHSSIDECCAYTSNCILTY